MKTGVFKTSYKENEKRIPIYPEHIQKINRDLREQLVFEEGYGLDYGYTDEDLKDLGCNIAIREELYQCDIIILPKPVAADLEQMKEGGILCGWTHAVQQRDIADLAIQKKLTLLAWEEMNEISKNGRMHIFYRNNELAGYAGVLHFLELKGLDGHYGERKKVVVIGFGSVSRGAIYALQGRGFNNITVYTNRPTHLVADKNPDVWYKSLNDEFGIYKDIKDADFIINGIMQDVNNPKTFISDEYSLNNLKPNTAIIDISCDKGMGFYFAEPTTFESPIIEMGRGVSYYSVDHTPTYLWNAASREISSALIPYLDTIMNPAKWEENPVINRSIDIRNGVVINENINKFQGR
jgi:N5-(carboxyethyl)ornithine synthase